MHGTSTSRPRALSTALGTLLRATSVTLLTSAMLVGCVGEIDGGPARGRDAPDPHRPPTGSDDALGTSFPRLAHAQWERSAQRALLLDEPTGESFDPDTRGDARFATNVARLVLTPTLAGSYRRAAEALADRVADDPARLSRLIGEGDAGVDARLDRAIASLLGRAFRRDATEDERRRYGALARSAPGFAEGDDDAKVREGLRTVIIAVLQSPHFLYRVERGREGEGTRSGDVLRVPLTERELATRWSYALFDAPPDEVLEGELASGALATDEGRRAVIMRMLADARADETILRFHRRLYGVDDYTTMRRDLTVFPGTESLGIDAERESTEFLRHVVAEDGGVRDLLLDRTGFVNRRLAELYSLPTDGRTDDVFERVELPETRPGILTRVGWTAWQADQLERRTILRGVFVIRNVLCEPLGPPASGNFAAAAMRGSPEGPATNRDLVAFRTEWADCASCHATRINPIGFAFENFDPLGRYVTSDRGLPIDAHASMTIDGEVLEYANAGELLARIAEKPAAHDCYASSAMEYLLGSRPLGVDATIADAIGEASLEDALSVRRIFAEILVSESFRTLRVPAPGVAR